MKKTLLSMAVIAACLASVAAHSAVVRTTVAPRQGADDRRVDDRGNDGPGHKAVLARRGADDGAGDDRGNDGPGHKAVLARRGADDGAGDDRGNDGPGHKVVLG